MVADTRGFCGLCSVAALLGFCVVPSAAHAQLSTWRFFADSGDFNSASNWDTNTVPTGTAVFENSLRRNLTITAPTTLGTLTISSGAPAYTFSNTQQWNFTVNGISNFGGGAEITN